MHRTLPASLLLLIPSLITSSPVSCGAEPGTGAPLNLTRGEVRRVASLSELKAALAGANQRRMATTLLLADGTYQLDGPALEISCPGLVLRSASGNREAVIVRGPDEGPRASVGNVFLVAANDVTIADLKQPHQPPHSAARRSASRGGGQQHRGRASVLVPQPGPGRSPTDRHSDTRNRRGNCLGRIQG